MSGLRARTLSGLKWSGAGQFARHLLQFAVSVFLARVLSPHEFGLMGMVLLFTGFASLFSEMGLGMALVQRKDLQDRHLSSIFWVNLASGALLTLAFAAGSSLVASFYGQPALRALTAGVGLNFLLGSLVSVQRCVLVRAMDFRRLFVIETAATVCSGLAAGAAALSGLGVWSLVAQSLTFTAVSALLLWRFSAWRPSPRIDIGALRELFGYSANLLGSNLLNFSNRNLDNLLIGKFLGVASLGVYTRAYELMLLPISQVTSILTRVMFPVLSSIQHDLPQVKRLYMRATRTIALFTFPLMIGLLVTAEPFVLAVYGEKWREVVPIIRILCFIGVIESITTTTGWIYSSQGRTDIQLRWDIYCSVVIATAFFIGLRWGIVGVAVGYVLSGYLVLYPWWRTAGGLIGLGFGEMASNLAAPFACAAAMGLAVWAFGLCLPSIWPPWALLAAQVPFGALVYLGLIHFLRLAPYLEVRGLAVEQLGWGSRFAPADGPGKTGML